MKILVLNAGSSSTKSCLYDLPPGDLPGVAAVPLWKANVEADCLVACTAAGARTEQDVGACDASAALLHTLWSGPAAAIAGPSEIDIVGHRVVHAGREFVDSVRIDEAVKAAIAKFVPLAPSHNPAALKGIAAVEQVLGPVPQVAVFDTAFHKDIPDAAALYPGPYAWAEQGIRRYGFHGISHRYCAGKAASLLGRPLDELRLITCHLGNGCSLAAVSGGHSVDTTMGFTPLEGLMMGTRSGSIDPGLLLYLLSNGATVDELDNTLQRESGLKGISGGSGDMREVTAEMKKGAGRSRLAFDMYVHRLRFHIGAMLAALGGLDALVFTGGVGENSAAVRAAACAAFSFLGLQVDAAKNDAEAGDRDIATAASGVRALVIAAQEDWAIAAECRYFAPDVENLAQAPGACAHGTGRA